jgi:hypothetical protein
MATMKAARSSLECRLFIELNVCACGQTPGELAHRLVSRDDRLVALYEGNCARCGRSLEYAFPLADEIVAADKFGGREPSQLIDAGQFLRESDRAARRVADSLAPESLYWLGRAIACLEEVLKWIPEGEERLPASAFFTEDGLRGSREEPGRFRRPRLVAVLAAYQEQLALARAQLG